MWDKTEPAKSTLIKICTEQIIPDSGRIIWQPNITIGYLDQYAEIDHMLTMKEFLKSAFAKLFEIETQVMQLYEKAADGDMKNLELAATIKSSLKHMTSIPLILRSSALQMGWGCLRLVLTALSSK